MDDPRADRLYELLVALFGSDAELQRFLALLGVNPNESRKVRTDSRSLSESAYETVDALVRQDRVDAHLFDRLKRRAPDRIDDIEQVQQLFDPTVETARSAPPPPAATSPGDLPMTDSLTEFARLLDEDLAKTTDSNFVATAVDPAHLPWTGAAAVLGSFNPTDLRQLSTIWPSPLRPTTALVHMITVSHTGTWTLRDEVRRTVLLQLDEQSLLDDALSVNDHIRDTRRVLLERVLHGWAGSLAEMDQQSLVDLDAVLGWLEPLNRYLPVTRTAVNAAADRRALIDPLRMLVGTHFRGREAELLRVRNQISSSGSQAPLFVVGAGGAGKSSLLGKVLLDLEEQAAYRPVAFAYIDFDKARHDPRDRSGLLRQLAQQLRLLYATSADVTGTFAAVESSYGGTDVEEAAELLSIDPTLPGDAVLETLCRALDRLHREQPQPEAAPLALVLDTCEEVLSKGPGAVNDLTTLLDELRIRLPGIRIVVAGRARLPWPGTGAAENELRLGDLDPEAADAVLKNQGVSDPELRELIVGRFGSNPLTLRLAAEGLRRAGTAQEAFSGIVASSAAFAEVALEQIQGMLYTRILGHIRDPEVASVAHPGLAVRRVTVPVIREVLAVPCHIDPARAEIVFDKLRADLSLFEPESPGMLVHRQDVRRLMLRTMADDAGRKAVVEDIHRAAANYYAHQRGPAARTEELYHRLMVDEDPRTLSPLWAETVGRSLESALEEPLPARSRRWLERRLSRVPVDEDRAEWEQEDWEAEAVTRARSWLVSNDPVQAQRVLSERIERLPGSSLHAVDVAVFLALNDLTAAVAALERGLHDNFPDAPTTVQLELLEQAVLVRARQGDASRLAEAAVSCMTLSDLLGESARGTRALATALTELRGMEANTQSAEMQRLLGARFEGLSRSQMRDDPELVRDVLHTAGLVDSGLLVHAALQVGDQTGEVDGVFAVDPFALTRVLDATTPEAGAAMQDLAVEVGMQREGWNTSELASRLVRTGRTGKGVALALAYAVDEDMMRASVVDTLVLPTPYSSA